MRDLILELIPNAPQLGLFVVPDIPDARLRNALHDYAKRARTEDVIALYDATLLGTAKDGAVFTVDTVFFQNNALEPVQAVRYADIVRVESKRKLIGGQKVYLDVNQGRATTTIAIDFSGKPDAAPYVARFLREAMLRGAAEEMDREPASIAFSAAGSDIPAVARALEDLVEQGLLSEADYARMMAALKRS